ncbi:MAG: NADH-quinone oxidoreductase subunit J [Proteobacteria bacterium]|nr:NADH-quinone oxidoreductase subunit J [Pseudomonadota bacterium]
MIPDLLFLAFSAGILLGATLVIAARNPMVGVMGMILTFLNAAGLFILFGAEFLGLLTIMVYVGAIAVMFLFVLMTIDIDYIKLKEGFAPYLPAGLLVVALLAAELILAAAHSPAQLTPVVVVGQGPQPQNVVALGQVLFTTYALPFQIAGFILLTAMVGAIVLTHRPRNDVKRQNVTAQVLRKREDAMVLTRPKTGAGATAKHWNPKSVAKKVKA